MIKSRSDLTNLVVFDKADFQIASAVSSSKGNVTKYTNGLLWIKSNYLGYEALAEVISSRVIQALGFETVVYDPCFLSRNEYEAESACVSQSFTLNSTEYSIGRLLQKLGKYNNSDEMFTAFTNNQTPMLRVQWVLDLLKPLNITDYLRSSLAECIWLDSILLNEDRHLFNLVLTLDIQNRFHFINFDYGGSLLSDLRDYPLAMPLQRAVYSVKSKPFSSRFSSQLRAFQDCLPTHFNKSIYLNITDLYDYFEPVYIQRCIDVLRYTLSKKGISLNLESDATSYFA